MNLAQYFMECLPPRVLNLAHLCFFLTKIGLMENHLVTSFFGGNSEITTGWWFQIFVMFIPIWGRFPS